MEEREEIIIEVSEDEAEKYALKGNAIILGGVEVHVQFVRYNGEPGIQVSWTPPSGPEDAPDWTDDINQRLANLSKETVMRMQDRPRLRLLKLVRKDGGRDRMLYRLFVTARIADDGTHEHRVIDFIDPEFLRIDPGVAVRAARAKEMVEEVLGGGMNSRSEFL